MGAVLGIIMRLGPLCIGVFEFIVKLGPWLWRLIGSWGSLVTVGAWLLSVLYAVLLGVKGFGLVFAYSKTNEALGGIGAIQGGWLPDWYKIANEYTPLDEAIHYVAIMTGLWFTVILVRAARAGNKEFDLSKWTGVKK